MYLFLSVFSFSVVISLTSLGDRLDSELSHVDVYDID
jgi:hypothetical protein